MEGRKSPQTNERAERRKLVFSLLKGHLYEDHFSSDTHGPELRALAKEMSQRLTEILQSSSPLMSDSGKRISFPIFTTDGRTVVKEMVIPKRIEEFLSELLILVEDASDPTPIEEQPTLDKYAEDIRKEITTAEQALESLNGIRGLLEKGILESKYFTPLWELLRDIATVAITKDIADCNTTTGLKKLSEDITYFQNQGLLDGRAIAELQQKISFAEHYLNVR